MEYICNRCGHQTATKGNLLTHLKRKKTCRPVLSDVDIQIQIDELSKRKYEEGYQCTFCDKMYSTRQNKWRHEQECKNKPGISQGEDIKVNKAEYDKMLEELMELRKQTHTTNNITNNITNNTQIINNFSVKLKDFGFENMDALTEENFETYFMNLELDDMVDKLHFADNYPENHNIRIKSTKRGLIEIYRNNKWNIVPNSSGLAEVVENCCKILKDYGRKNETHIIQNVMDESEYRENIYKLKNYDHCDDYKTWKQGILLKLETNRNSQQPALPGTKQNNS